MALLIRGNSSARDFSELHSELRNAPHPFETQTLRVCRNRLEEVWNSQTWRLQVGADPNEYRWHKNRMCPTLFRRPETVDRPQVVPNGNSEISLTNGYL